MAAEPRTGDRRQAGWLLVVVGVAAVLRLASVDLDSFWLDEASTARASRLPFLEMLAERARAGHPPLFFAVTWVLTRLAGQPEWLLRLPAAVAGIVAVPLLYRLVRSSVGGPAGAGTALLAAALLAVDPLQLELSLLARGYAWVVVVGLATSILLVEDPGDGRGRRRGWRIAAFVLLWVLGLHVHYSALLVLAAQLLYAAGRRRWPFVVAGILAAATLLPWILWSRESGQQLDANLGWLPPLSRWTGLLWLLNQWLQLSWFSMDPAVRMAVWLGMVPVLALAVLGAVRSARRQGPDRVLVVLWLVPPLLALGATLFDLNLLHKPRYWATSAAVFPALVAVGIAALPARSKVRAAIAAAVLVAFAAGSAVELGQPQGTDWRGMVRILEAERRAGEDLRVLPDLPFRLITLRHYYGGDYRVLGESVREPEGREEGSPGDGSRGVWVVLSPRAFEAAESRDPALAEAAARELADLERRLPVRREYPLRAGRLIHLQPAGE